MKQIYTRDGVVEHIDEDDDYEVSTDDGYYWIHASDLNIKLKVGDKVRATITLLQEK